MDFVGVPARVEMTIGIQNWTVVELRQLEMSTLPFSDLPSPLDKSGYQYIGDTYERRYDGIEGSSYLG